MNHLTSVHAVSSDYWQEIAHKRLRLAALALTVGIIAGFILHMIVTAPPVWIDQLQAECGAL